MSTSFILAERFREANRTLKRTCAVRSDSRVTHFATLTDSTAGGGKRSERCETTGAQGTHSKSTGEPLISFGERSRPAPVAGIGR
jgi:hypothetical protein